MTNQEFEVIVLATDIFGYYWARSFYQEYQLKSYALGNFASEYTTLSNLFKEIRIEKNLFDPATFVETVIDFAKDIKDDNPDKKVLLIPTNDHFVRYMIENEDQLKQHLVFNLPNEELLNNLMLKENFYPFVDKFNLPIPETSIQAAQEVYQSGSFLHFPAIIKPSSSVGWKGLDFAEYEKVYYCQDEQELKRILDAIRQTDYQGNLIIQEYVGGDDTNLWDIVTYSDSKGRVQFINMSQVLLQEPSKFMVGNYTALISRFDKPFMEKIVNFLNKIGYTGFANFDLKLDPKDQELKIFEVNLRAGRSNFSAEQMGASLAKHLVEDLVYDNHARDVEYLDKPNLFSFVPKSVLKRHIKDDYLKSEAIELIKKGHYRNPLNYNQDKSMKRSVFLQLRALNYHYKYRNGTWQ